MSKSGKGGLNSLLSYRFVKKPKPKLQHEGSTSSQDSDETKCPSDDNTNQSSDPNLTNSIPNGKSEDLKKKNSNSVSSNELKDTESLDGTQKYWDEADGPDTVISVSVIDSRQEDIEPTTVPETPASPLSQASSPESPLFRAKPKNIRSRALEEEPSEASGSSPWMSKEQGRLTNGCGLKAKGRVLSDSSDEETEEEDKGMSAEDEVTLNNLKEVFPSQPLHVVRQAFLDAEKIYELAVERLVDTGKHNFKKKKRVMRMNSSDSEISQEPPSKRARSVISSDDQEEDVDSQATIMNNSQSQDGVIGYTTQEERIKFLSESFPTRSRRSIYRALETKNWLVDEAAEMLDLKKKENGRDDDMDLSDEDEDFQSGDEAEDSENSLDDGADEHQTEKEMILAFFQDANQDELAGTPGCSKKKAEILLKERPFKSFEDLHNKCATVKGLTTDLIGGCREIIRVRDVIIRLMQKCEKISMEMERVVTYLTQQDSIDESDNRIHITKQPALLNSEFQLKPFQMVGLNWLRIMHSKEINGILADEMGLGKTIQTISFIAHLLEEGEEGPHVIIVPSSTIDNWLREFSVWCPAVKVLVYYGSQEDRRVTRRSILYEDFEDFHVILTTYNMATGSVEDRSLFKKFEFHYSIFDEGHMLKNMSSLRYQNLMKIQSERRLLLTGTPLQNNLLELMSLLCFVMPDMFIGKTDHLKRMFSMITKSVDDKRSKYEAERIAHAKQIMKPFILRRLKSEVQKQLPKKSERVELCEMIPEQAENYHNLVNKFQQELRESSVGPGETKGGASMLMQLRKAANHPLLQRRHYTDKLLKEMSKHIAKEPSHRERQANPKLIFEDMCVMHDFEIHKLCKFYEKHIGKYSMPPSAIQDSAKFRVLDDLLVKLKSQDDRVLIFSQFTMMMDIMEDYLKQKKYKYMRLDGSTPVPDRLQMIDEYTNNPDIFIFLLSTKAGGLGINLTAANVVIIHDIDFNPYNDKQAEDRCHRVGQKREVSIVRLITKDTVEEGMLRCAQEKLKLEKDITTNEGSDNETGADVASLLKEALGRGKV
ncbi:SWI/SNF-related matrix-associated actin-dependent regulator of chromatin subfamily A containing DEAD/H box 1B-like [Ylistrum balloti]|uniref:SWI/SNF-related matrix-associated actin-dependent regulator of chromatin subfamily A containing DEAD/H box 1B-like n=1 Tax=Ylistrum balloti TaxID=509963 RepID=UPI002905A5A5|nr:SWI/SNF-related matrix-associated actin-dependent regulator of chromatin subfamily A containing DEAD/H box 1B-like [Ylistrum balloti]